MKNYQSYLFSKTFLLFGKGVFKRLPNYIGTQKALIVCSKRQLKRTPELSKMGYIFSSFHTHPSIEEVNNGVISASYCSPDIIVGIGGGSAMDVAKGVAYYYDKKTVIIQVPTTAGSGSEVTRWASIWDFKKQKKNSLEDDALYADIVLLDPNLTLTLPKDVTINSGIDAFSHALEAFWAKKANFISDEFAILAMKKIWNNIKIVSEEPLNLEARSEMLKGSLLAGLAFNGTKTTAIHSISYALTLLYSMPHGKACAFLLPELLEFNSEIIENKLKRLFPIFEVENISSLTEKIRLKIKELGFSFKFENVDIEKLVKKSYSKERMENNPRMIKKKDLKKIFERLE